MTNQFVEDRRPLFCFLFFSRSHQNLEKIVPFFSSVLLHTKPEIPKFWADLEPTFGSRRPCLSPILVRYTQYLNCKILHGGMFLQPWPKAFGMWKCFSGNYVFPSPKSSKDPKKRSRKVFSEKKSFCLQNQLKTKKNRSSTQFRTKFGRNLWDLVVLTSPFLSDQPALKSR